MVKEICTSSPLRNFVLWLSSKPRVTGAIARHGMRQGFARRFVAGSDCEEGIAMMIDRFRSSH